MGKTTGKATATLEEEACTAGNKPNRNFNEKPKVVYEPVHRAGWGDLRVDGGGDPDSVDYTTTILKE